MNYTDEYIKYPLYLQTTETWLNRDCTVLNICLDHNDIKSTKQNCKAGSVCINLKNGEGFCKGYAHNVRYDACHPSGFVMT